MVKAELGLLAHFELLNHGHSALIFVTTAHDGSAPPRASFIAMLMFEYTIADKCSVTCKMGMTISGHAAVPVIIARSDSVATVTRAMAELNVE